MRVFRLFTATVMVFVGACDSECPTTAEACPSGCDALRGTQVTPLCDGELSVVGCVDDGPEGGTADIGCAVRVEDDEVFWTTSGTIADELISTGDWRRCNNEERLASQACP